MDLMLVIVLAGGLGVWQHSRDLAWLWRLLRRGPLSTAIPRVSAGGLETGWRCQDCGSLRGECSDRVKAPSAKRCPIRLDADAYPRLLGKAMERDGWRCQYCGSISGL